MLGWNGIGFWKVREGGMRGYSFGKESRQRKHPPIEFISLWQEKERPGWGERHTTVVFAVVADHERDFPLKNIVIDETAGDSGEVFGGLHVFQLSAKKTGCTTLCHHAEADRS
jgi:hypothetical protein